MSLLEEVCQLGCFRGFKMPYHLQLAISASYLWIRMSALRYSSNDMTTCCHDHGFYLSAIVCPQFNVEDGADRLEEPGDQEVL